MGRIHQPIADAMDVYLPTGAWPQKQNRQVWEDMMELKEAIAAMYRTMIMGQIDHPRKEALALILSAAEKWEVMDWMHESGFADDYSFGYVMEHMQDFIDAYRKAKEGE